MRKPIQTDLDYLVTHLPALRPMRAHTPANRYTWTYTPWLYISAYNAKQLGRELKFI